MRGDLIEKEKESRAQYMKISHLFISLLKQQTKLQWLNQGDHCTKLFFAKVKQRQIQTYVYLILDKEGFTVEGFEIVAHKFSECMDCSAELLLQRKPSDIESALQVIAKALVISSYSEQLLERKAKALFMMQHQSKIKFTSNVKVHMIIHDHLLGYIAKR
ncbi:hypothetical protein Cgig2_025077 [Carnegiea gigantea]|uniref:Uncharacterized protein n=1 Tax=Carnegiea gigantea TaxID=171969 RepID=A0A9Q1QJQ9_9CARY|nr:hypothetical protein Cgig2_025077 [Carnegiea gigantea]